MELEAHRPTTGIAGGSNVFRRVSMDLIVDGWVVYAWLEERSSRWLCPSVRWSVATMRVVLALWFGGSRLVRRPWRLGCWVRRPRGAPPTPHIFAITVVSNSGELDLANYQLQ